MNAFNNSFRKSRDAVSIKIADLVVNTASQLTATRGAWKPFRPTPQRRAGATDFVPLNTFSPVYKDCINTIAGEVFHHDEKAAPAKGEADLLCISLIHCKTLEEALQRTLFFAELTRKYDVSLHIARDRARFIMATHHRQRRSNEFICDFFGLAFFYKLFSWLIGEPLRRAEIDLSHQRLVDPDITGSIVALPLRYRAEQNAISFDAAMLRKPITRTYQELMDVLSVGPFELLPLPSSANLPIVIEGLFAKALEQGAEIPSLATMASALARSVPTLRRHLALENTSYQELLEQFRLNKAVEFLTTTTLSIDKVSNDLGFSAASSFSRAFKSWTGSAPSDFRENHKRSM
jgi:AraC-like DNA-binding protein